MTDRVYIHPLREGSDDCWDAPGFSWGAYRYWMATCDQLKPPPRLCAVWTGTSDRDTLAHFGTSVSDSPADD